MDAEVEVGTEGEVGADCPSVHHADGRVIAWPTSSTCTTCWLLVYGIMWSWILFLLLYTLDDTFRKSGNGKVFLYSELQLAQLGLRV